jgi:hypothetical protein
MFQHGQAKLGASEDIVTAARDGTARDGVARDASSKAQGGARRGTLASPPSSSLSSSSPSSLAFASSYSVNPPSCQLACERPRVTRVHAPRQCGAGYDTTRATLQCCGTWRGGVSFVPSGWVRRGQSGGGRGRTCLRLAGGTSSSAGKFTSFSSTQLARVGLRGTRSPLAPPYSRHAAY